MAQLVRAPPCHGGGRGFESHSGRFGIGIQRDSTIFYHADMAQLAEQLICNQQVIGSSPIIGLSGKWNEHQPLSDRNLYGGIPEWPKGADCKSVSCAFSGSNPLSPTLVYLKGGLF